MSWKGPLNKTANLAARELSLDSTIFLSQLQSHPTPIPIFLQYTTRKSVPFYPCPFVCNLYMFWFARPPLPWYRTLLLPHGRSPNPPTPFTTRSMPGWSVEIDRALHRSLGTR